MSNHSQIASSINDAYFTNKTSAEFCVSKLEDHGWLKPNISLLEPSAGSGALVKPIVERYKDITVVSRDLIDYGIGAVISDYLLSNAERFDLVFTNPPFGKMASLAIKFFNRAALDSNRIAFIVPKSFRKASIISKLDKFYWPVADYDLPNESYELPDGSTRNVSTCLQLWERRTVERPSLKIKMNNQYFKLSSENDPNAFTIRTQGSASGKVLDGFGHSPNTSRIISGDKSKVKSLDLSKLAGFTASVPALGLTELYYAMHLQETNQELLKKYLDKGVIALLI